MNEPWYPGRPMQPKHGQHGTMLLRAAAIGGGVEAHTVNKHHVCGSGSQILSFSKPFRLSSAKFWDDAGRLRRREKMGIWSYDFFMGLVNGAPEENRTPTT